MHYLGSLRYYVLSIYILSIFIYVVYGISSRECINCLTTSSKARGKVAFNGSIFPEETAKWHLVDGYGNATKEIPQAPEEIYPKVVNGELSILWLANPNVLYGLKYLRHIVLVLEHLYSQNGTYKHIEYVLFNVSRVNEMTVFVYKHSQLRPGTFEINATLWFLGKLENSSDDHFVTTVDRLSRSKSKVVPRQYLVQEFIAAKKYTDSCICGSKISVSLLKITKGLMVKVQAFNLPNDTYVEIQLKRNGNIEDTIKSTGQELMKLFIKKWTKSNGSYFVRILRHCQRKYTGILSCDRDEAEWIRSVTVTIKGSNTSRLSRISSFSSVEGFGGLDISQVLQVAAITITFAISIIIELVLIILLATEICCPKRNSAGIVRRSTYVRINDNGGTDTRVISSRRVDIIFAKDSQRHEETVERINNDLIRRGIDSVVINETTSQEIMANWGQAAENVVTRDDVILLIITPHLYNICKKKQTNVEDIAEGTKDLRTNKHTFTLFPSAVLDALKTRTLWADTNKVKCVAICLAETKEEFYELSAKMRKEHPLIFKDKIYFNNFRHDNDSNNRKQIKKLIRAINLR